jgi:D-alanyl-D-alanine carboxypeptidase/D-alanyl-D-alanine-endopeptidase (penicillin-binding protein 4)
MKLIATTTALVRLGPEYRYRTDLYGVGEVDRRDGVLHGDLLLPATGDPTLSDRFYPSDEAPLDSLAAGLEAAGIRSVTGALVVDASAWDSTTVPGTWMVANLTGTSGATGGAFAFAEGELAIEVTAGPEAGSPATASWWPSVPAGFLSVEFVTVHPDSSARRRSVQYLPESHRIRVAGQIRAGEVDTIRISQRDPVRLASQALHAALSRRGIQIDGGLRLVWDRGEPVGPGECVTGAHAGSSSLADEHLPGCPEATFLTGLSSPPMAEIAKAILEPSQNWMTEQLVRTLGAERGSEGSWREGFDVEREFLTQEIGVDSLAISYHDGSGLSAYNLVSPLAVVQILEYMKRSNLAGIFRNALASPREEGSTLRNRLVSLEGRVFGKTGTITHVNSLSGYVFTDSGRELIFSILTNGSGLPSGQVRDAIDRIVEIASRQ